MPRANRHYVRGQVWHITHRCHESAFLLKFVRDRRRYCDWLRVARLRYGVCVLDYMVTSNHVHLLIQDLTPGSIARTMQLVSSRTAQEFNARKSRHGAFWEDRYHATAIETGQHLLRCVAYIDLNMVRAGAVRHPEDWEPSGYSEIQARRQRDGIIDRTALARLCGFDDLMAFQKAHASWIDGALQGHGCGRDPRWSRSLAVGGAGFIDDMRRVLCAAAVGRAVETGADSLHVLREARAPYSPRF